MRYKYTQRCTIQYESRLYIDLLSEKNKIIKVHAQSKNSLNCPLTSFEELYSLGNKWTLPQAALHTAMNLEIRLRTLTVMTIY